jgi:Fe-S oxidoreductase
VERTGAASVVTTCSGCYTTFAHHYPEQLGLAFPVPVLHLSQFLAERRPDLALPSPMRLAYHDPCTLGRTARVFEPPRDVLQAVEGVTLVEPPLSREKSVCCGGGGGVWALDNPAASAAGASRLARDVLPMSVDALVTCCPVCHLNFRRTLRKQKSKVRILDLAELAARAIEGETPEAPSP